MFSPCAGSPQDGREYVKVAKSVVAVNAMSLNTNRQPENSMSSLNVCVTPAFGTLQDGREYVKEAKNVVAVLGGVDAVIALMKRVNKRCEHAC